MRILITGATGFVGPHLARAIRDTLGDGAAIFATALHAGTDSEFGKIEALDVTNADAVDQTLRTVRPSHVVNLAALAAPSAANADPSASWRIHLDGPRNLAQAILRFTPDCVLLNIGSGLVYGRNPSLVTPTNEDAVPAPIDEYGASKAAADLALGALVRQGLRCLRFRPFNHTGPGQTEAFVVPAFARQIARIEAKLAPQVLEVGNLLGARDFLDVRDVVRVYVEAIVRTEALQSGLILNVASGLPRRIGDILQQLLTMARVPIDVGHDPARDDASDVILGDAARARELLGWKPMIPFEATLKDVLDDQRRRIAAAG